MLVPALFACYGIVMTKQGHLASGMDRKGAISTKVRLTQAGDVIQLWKSLVLLLPGAGKVTARAS